MERLSPSIEYVICRDFYVYNTIQNYPQNYLVLDTRPLSSYSKNRMSRSLHLRDTVYDSEDKATRKIDQQKLEAEIAAKNAEIQTAYKMRKRNFIFIFCQDSVDLSEWATIDEGLMKDANNERKESYILTPDMLAKIINEKGKEPDAQFESFSLALRLKEHFSQEKVREVYLIHEGWRSLFGHFPFLNISQRRASFSDKWRFPSEILDSKLFVGNEDQATNERIIDYLSITHVINVTHHVKNAFETTKNIKYLKIELEDVEESNLQEYFPIVYDWMEEAYTDKKARILIHCSRGMSRSPTLAIMYIMRKLKWDLSKTLDYVTGKRTIVKPNAGFLKQLREFESTVLFGSIENHLQMDCS